MTDDSSISHAAHRVARCLRTESCRALLAAALLAVVGCIIYRNFVFGEDTLLYKDIGSDSLNIFYPFFVHLSDYLRHSGFPSWSFSVGMGQALSIVTGNLLLHPVTWLPRDAIAEALVWEHLGKITIAGLLFRRFLQLRGANFTAALTGALLLSFSAYSCMGSCWYTLADEVLSISFLLFAAETALAKGRWIYLPLAVAFGGLVSAFHLYLCAVVLCFYIPSRLIGQHGASFQHVMRTSFLLGLTAVLGVGISAIVTADGFYALLNSPRGSGSVSSAATLAGLPVFGFQSSSHYVTAVLRFFANDMAGSATDFKGWRNYLEAPVTYAGLFTLVIFPQVFVKATLRERILYSVFLGLLVLITVFPWFRYLFWLFRGDYYRTFSLFSAVGLITLGATAFCRHASRETLNVPILGITVLGLIGLLYLPLSELSVMVDAHLRRVAVTFIFGYALLLISGHYLRRHGAISWIIVGLVAGEAIYFNRVTVSGRPVVGKQELRERAGYNDHTREAVQDVRAQDPSFFRITKTWGSSPAQNPSLNDALVFNYYGTPSYSSFNSLDYINFLRSVDAIPATASEIETRWSLGLLRHPLLSTFACEKYVLTRDPVPFQNSGNYRHLKMYGDSYLLENINFLPLGVSYTSYVPESVFLKFSQAEKTVALFQAVVLSDTDAAAAAGLARWTIDQAATTASLHDLVAERRATALAISFFDQNRIEGSIQLERKTVIVFQMPFDRGWRAAVNGQRSPVLKVNAGLLGVAAEAGYHSVALHYRPPFFGIGLALTLISTVALGLIAWRWPLVRIDV